ncbi:MAG TPA: hypothetical protein V6C58_06740, partial [Allocoleopsis sp.]
EIVINDNQSGNYITYEEAGQTYYYVSTQSMFKEYTGINVTDPTFSINKIDGTKFPTKQDAEWLLNHITQIIPDFEIIKENGIYSMQPTGNEDEVNVILLNIKTGNENVFRFKFPEKIYEPTIDDINEEDKQQLETKKLTPQYENYSFRFNYIPDDNYTGGIDYSNLKEL